VKYKHQIATSDIREAYKFLIQYVMSVKNVFEKKYSEEYSCGNVSPGYMDFTYFPFFTPFLRKNKLRFGIVLNHEQLRFELWLMGQNANVQDEYWKILKTSRWNQQLDAMPTYSVLEVVLVEQPNFEARSELTTEIIEHAVSLAAEITEYLEAATAGEVDME
jgi:hypothetical protein